MTEYPSFEELETELSHLFKSQREAELSSLQSLSLIDGAIQKAQVLAITEPNQREGWSGLSN